MCGFPKGNNPLVLQNTCWGLRCLGTKNTPSKIHFQWSIKGHIQPWRLKLPRPCCIFHCYHVKFTFQKKKISEQKYEIHFSMTSNGPFFRNPPTKTSPPTSDPSSRPRDFSASHRTGGHSSNLASWLTLKVVPKLEVVGPPSKWPWTWFVNGGWGY